MFTVSQSAVQQVVNDIHTGNTAYADEFFAARPDWRDQDEQANVQTDYKQQEKKEVQTAQA